MPDERFILEDRRGHVGIIQLHRPDVLNALSPQVLAELSAALSAQDADPGIRVIVLTGNDRAFAAGADLKAMVDWTPELIEEIDTGQYWSAIRNVTKPVIAAVSGFAFGGGCELAMMCDLIVASETARFAQPEIKVGIMPGAGGTQRLVKAIGPYRAMEMVLTGEPISAEQAYAFGLVNRVVPVERYLDEAIQLASQIAARPPVAVRSAKQALRRGVETTLEEGLALERENYIGLYETEDQQEGMRAFLEKREPVFKGK
ncbi:MAG: enoyl-CoA hydratase-related protein [Anaerolineales bacterium]|nr:enoyl-CoA hydratase-related protein [Anaerolineales bacterium]